MQSNLPLPLRDGGWGEGSAGAGPTPPPNPLPQGEGGSPGHAACRSRARMASEAIALYARYAQSPAGRSAHPDTAPCQAPPASPAPAPDGRPGPGTAPSAGAATAPAALTPARLRECQHCGQLQVLPPMPPAARAVCLRCDAVLRHTRHDPLGVPLALNVTALVLFFIATSNVLLTVSRAGQTHLADLFTGPSGWSNPAGGNSPPSWCSPPSPRRSPRCWP